MFYFIVSKYMIPKNYLDKYNMFKIVIIGTLCYLVLHALLYSEKLTSYKIIEKYRSYIYYLMAGDFFFMNIHRAIFIPDNYFLASIKQNNSEEEEGEGEGEEESTEVEKKKEKHTQIIKKEEKDKEEEKEEEKEEREREDNNKQKQDNENESDNEEGGYEEMEDEISDTTIVKYER